MSNRAQRGTRLRGKLQFAHVLHGVRARGVVLSLSAASNTTGELRTGIAVRGVRSAVLRNRIRRRVREVMREQLGVVKGTDFVVKVGTAAAGVPFQQLREDFSQCLAITMRKMSDTSRSA